MYYYLSPDDWIASAEYWHRRLEVTPGRKKLEYQMWKAIFLAIIGGDCI